MIIDEEVEKIPRDVCPLCETEEAKPYELKIKLGDLNLEIKSIKCVKCQKIVIFEEDLLEVLSQITKENPTKIEE